MPTFEDSIGEMKNKIKTTFLKSNNDSPSGKHICCHETTHIPGSGHELPKFHTGCQPIPQNYVLNRTYYNEIHNSCYKCFTDVILSDDYNYDANLIPVLNHINNIQDNSYLWSNLRNDIINYNNKDDNNIIINFKWNNESDNNTVSKRFKIESEYYDMLLSDGCVLNLVVQIMENDKVILLISILDVCKNEIVKTTNIDVSYAFNIRFIQNIKQLPITTIEKLILLTYSTYYVSHFGIKILLWSQYEECMKPQNVNLTYNIPIKNMMLVNFDALLRIICQKIAIIATEIKTQKYDELKRECEMMDIEYNNQKKQNEAILIIENKKLELKKLLQSF
jgi:hypothetical protein